MNKTSLLSFDIWDTVLRRNCHPDEIKLHTAKYLFLKYYHQLNPGYSDPYSIFVERQACEHEIGQEAVQSGKDDEYSIEQVFMRLNAKVLQVGIPLDFETIANELIEVEMQQERRMIYLDPSIEQTLSSIPSEKAVFISDFYTDKERIKSLLSSVGFSYPYHDGYVSCEHELNKRSGKLFAKIHGELGINPSEHFHLGDNAHSDVHSPGQLGMKTLHYLIPDEEKKRAHLGDLFHNRKQNLSRYVDNLKSKLQTVAPRNTDGWNEGQKQMFEIGRDHALILYTFVLWIIEDAIRNQTDTVYYFTREGELFKAIHEAIRHSDPLGMDIPKPELLEVSRLATFSASLREFTLHELMRIWNQYSTQSMTALFKSLNISIEPYLEYFKKYEIAVEDSIQYPWLDARVQRLFEDLDFIRSAEEEIERKREALLHYFEGKGFTRERSSASIVDIGWRGTIQDNLAFLFDRTKINGYYLGLFDYINLQPENTRKFAFVDKPHMHILRFVAPVEMLCNSPNGSVLEYIVDNNDKRTTRKKIEEKENLIHQKYIQFFQEGVLDAIPAISDWVNTHALTVSELQQECYTVLEGLLKTPPYMLTEAFFNLSHNETFGLGKFVEKKVPFPYFKAAKAVISKSGKREFKDYIEETSWAQGFLIYHKLDVLNRVYNRFMDKRLGVNSLENSCNGGDSRDKVIEEQHRLLEERYQAMMAMERMIRERDQTIDSQNQLLLERFQAIQEMDQMIKERDLYIKDLEMRLKEKKN